MAALYKPSGIIASSRFKSPEAFTAAPILVGLIAVAGFAAYFVLSKLSS
jgi:hypothetical protein